MQDWIKPSENSLGSNDTPQDRRRVEGGGVWTRKLLWLMWRTVILDRGDGEVDDGDRNETANNTGDHLNTEQGSWRNSQVVSLLLIGDVVLGLSIDVGTQGLDEVQSNTITWEGITSDQLNQDVKGNRSTCGGIHHAER